MSQVIFSKRLVLNLKVGRKSCANQKLVRPLDPTIHTSLRVHIYQGTIGCTPNSVPMVFIIIYCAL